MICRTTCRIPVIALAGIVASGAALGDAGAPGAPGPGHGLGRVGPAIPYAWPPFAGVFASGAPLLHEGCNTIAYGSTPDLGTHLIGRVMNGDPVTRGEPTACPGAAGAPTPYDLHESLSLVELDPLPDAALEIEPPLRLARDECQSGGGLSLCYGSDGELTLRSAGRTLWSSASYRLLDAPGSDSGAPCNGCLAQFQTDGNLVLYRPDMAGAARAYWASGTAGHGGARLRLSRVAPYVSVIESGRTLLFPHHVAYRYKVLDTRRPVPIEGGRQQIVSAYDASVAPFEGEYWVAFECALSSGVTAACVGPLVAPGGRFAIDSTRISVVATGQCSRALSVCLAASVPKLIEWRGALYMAWDDLRVDNRGHPRNDWASDAHADVQQYFIGVDARGARLERAAGTERLYVEGHHGAIVENDASASALLASNIDLSQLVVAGEHVLAIGSLTQAESACAMPLNHVSNCYRLAFASAASPWGPFHLLRSEAHGLAAVDHSDGLPERPALYYRFVYLPDSGRTALLGGVFFDIATPAPHLVYTIESERYLWPENLLRPVCDPEAQPYPQWMQYGGRCLDRRRGPAR